MISRTLTSAALAVLSAFTIQPTFAQTTAFQPLADASVTAMTESGDIDLSRAKNLARQAAEQENGGLSQYRAEDSMHGPAVDSPYYVNDDGTITFSFYGNAPGESENSFYSVVSVDPASGLVTVEQNDSQL